MHFACINPNSEILTQVLAVNDDINMLDTEMRRPIHYAACCETTENLKILIAKGANVMDVDCRKVTCLHAAVMAGRAVNAKFIIQ
jgi:ankyrin repeat protein